MEHLIFNIGLLLFFAFGIFIYIVHRQRRSEMPDKFIPEMDFGPINVIATLKYFFKRMKDKKKK